MIRKSVRRKKKSRKKLSPEEKLRRRVQRKLFRDFRKFMIGLGFYHVNVDGIEIAVGGRPGELDDIFVHENVVLLTEYTTGKKDSSHILSKLPFFNNIQADIPRFLSIAKGSYPNLAAKLNPLYDETHFRVRILYVPLHEAAQETAKACPAIHFLQGGLKKYFFALANTIQRSARIEFFSYLGLAQKDVGEAATRAVENDRSYAGQLLPHTMSSFPKGFKVVSFYADPESLMAGAYVLRRDGWRDSSHLYQRILIRAKISKMRRYLVDEQRVFVTCLSRTLKDPLYVGL